MSNNLVSEPMPSMQMAQLQPIVTKVDSTAGQMDMGLLAPVTADPTPQQRGGANDHVGLLRDGSGDPRSRGLSNSAMQSVRVEARMSNMGPQQLVTTPKRKAPMELSTGSSVTSNKRVAQGGNRPWLQQASNLSNKGSAQMQSPSNASPRPQQSAVSNKRKVQMTESVSSKSSTPRSSNSKNQNTQMKQPSKVQTESSESVRSKMRESLAGALALVSKQDKPTQNNNTMNDAATNGKLENSSQWDGSAPAPIDIAPEQRQDISESAQPSFSAAGSVDHATGEQRNNASSSEDFSEKFKDFEMGSINISNNENILGLNCDKQDFQSDYTLTTDDVPFSDSFFVKDDLLQGNGLSWVLSDVVGMDNQKESQNVIEQRPEPEEPLPEVLASRIEEELFKLFGGVNKKYKEKGRSLLFNLKDRNNPELREKVMSGDIRPEQLCSMTAEELASKELSQWRIAKAEELAQMVVLPDSDVDIKRLVKKTHKGEFQVEVEHEDNVPIEEISSGTTSSRSLTSRKGGEARSQKTKKGGEATSSKSAVVKENKNTDGEKSNSEKDNAFSITISSNDGTDPMQGLMTDDALKDPDFLPPIVSLDEFMESLHSEPPFENLPMESGKEAPESNKDDSEVGSKSKSLDITPREQAGVTPDKSENLDAKDEKLVNAESGSISDRRCNESEAGVKPTDDHAKERLTDNKKNASVDAELRTSNFHAEERYGNNSLYAKTAVHTKGECFWDGMLQLNISTTDSVISIFKSGEKTTAKDWPGFLEIKGRVRLEAFEKFLQDLPQSRSRAIMVVHFVSKGSSPSQQSTLREVAESYITDERVGFAEPVSGVELYFCPPHNKTVEMLSKILPKEQIEAVNSIDNGLIGIIVWRKTNLTSSTISPTASSQHKHSSSSSKRQQYFSRRQQDGSSNLNVNVANPSNPPPNGVDDDDDDDIPPGFGPHQARPEDDLPEFSFMGGPNTSSHMVQRPRGPPGMVPFQMVNQAPSRPVDQMRELVHKYGQSKVNSHHSGNWQDKFGGSIQPWNDDDDDIPEWQPQNSQQNHQFPPPPPPQLALHQQNFHLRPHLMNQSFPGSPTLPTPPHLQPPMNVTHGQRNIGPNWVPPNQGNNHLQPSGGQHYGAPMQGTWPENVTRSRGF
ncbi:hypothetical protein HN51_020352 [Arachis hypogaea]|uniref:TFIIS central domain-containing protein n=1 Tax=Arachis hypogaea TaxID=3818 RepID=A0A445C0M1_ARAHY|nr:uncharacterized protein LOC112707820 [Arachis hypogaea]QHO32291.1 PHD finger protein [Arachis hypogaea]RYR44468.1 hypothetical protein Ahy_A08g040795 [Arachis hypogaea]